MDWYEAVKAWQERAISADDAIGIAEVEDVWELWELALGAGITIKRANREDIENILRAKRAIGRGEKSDVLDAAFEMDLVIADTTEDDLKRRLRLKWIPTLDGFDFNDLANYERFLSLSHQEQLAFLATLPERDYELYESLMISQACYRPPEDM